VIILKGCTESKEVGGYIVLNGRLVGRERVDSRLDLREDVEVIGEAGEVAYYCRVEVEVEGD
jgi:hypothetical protein